MAHQEEVKVKTFDELRESRVLSEGKEESKAIRKILRDKYKLTPRDVGVTNKYGGYSSAVTMTVKTEKALLLMDELKKISKEFEKYERDFATQEILLGGNTYVFVQMDYKLARSLEDKIKAEFKKKSKDGFEQAGDSVELYKTFNIGREDKKIYVSGIKGGSVIQVNATDEHAVAQGVMTYISQHGKPSMYGKIK